MSDVQGFIVKSFSNLLSEFYQLLYCILLAISFWQCFFLHSSDAVGLIIDADRVHNLLVQ